MIEVSWPGGTMNLGRMASISKVLLDEGLGFLLPDRASDDTPPPDADLAVRLRRTLERLGPTFVKFGQLLSTRVDLFSEPVLAELAKLQASVPPFDTALARERVAEELGRPIEAVFAEFPDAPVAAASIAQVYRARLRDGAVVAVKVQRPDLETSLLADLDALLELSGLLDRLVPPYHRSMVHRVAQEYAGRARTEVDFGAEAETMDRFGAVLGALPEFRVPALHLGLCTPRLLVMEWVDGTRLDKVAGPDELRRLGFEPEPFCRSMLRLQLSMAYEHGLVHGDTHPGNLVLEPTGRIALLDFGLHGTVPRALRDKMLEVVFCQASGRIDDAVSAFVEVFQPEAGVDQDLLKRELHEVLSVATVRGPLRDHRVTEQLVQGMRVGARHRLRVRSDLFVVIRNLTIVEGIVLRYCPELDAVQEVRDITGAILRRNLLGPRMREDFQQLLPQLALTLSQRPRLVERLLALERAFHEAPSLGAFLRRQDVLRDPPRTSPWPIVTALAVGIAIGLALARILP